MTSFKMLIGGDLVEGARSLAVINPATGDVFAECACADKDDISRAVEAAADAQPYWAALPLSGRSRLLHKLADAVEEKTEHFARLLTQEQGKPLAESQGEAIYTAAFIRYFANCTLDEKQLVEDNAKRVIMRRKPLGVVAAIVPWNFPILTVAFKLPPALLAGNTVVVKPAATTPLTTLMLAELCADIFPPGVVNVVVDNNDLGGVLTSHPKVAKIAFTGSTATGRKVMAAAADTIKRITLELGGNDASIVLDDADPAKVAEGVFNGAFMNCGQVCIAIKRLYVHESIHDQVRDELLKIVQSAVVGDGLEPETQIGPLQNKAQYEKVRGIIDGARKQGGVVHGGETMNRPGYFIRPAIVTGLSDGCELVDVEQFGPVLPLIPYNDLDEAINRANASEYGLGGSIWSSDMDRAVALSHRIEAGTVWINKHLDFGPDIPFAGAKQSGLGVEFAEEGLAEFTQRQVVNAAL